MNVVDLKAGGLGNLGDEQLEWLEDDVKGLSSSTPIVVFAHIPLWTVYPEWGWGTEDGAARSVVPAALRLRDRAQRPHSPDHAEGGGQRRLPHRALHRLPATRAGHGRVTGAAEGAGGRVAQVPRRDDGQLRPGPASPSPSSIRP